GIGVEGTKVDRLRVRLDRLIEEPAWRRQEEIAEGLQRLRLRRIDLRGGAELGRRLPAIPERQVHRAERVLCDDEVRIGFDGARQEVDRALVGFLPARTQRDLRASVQLEGAKVARGARRLVDARALRVADRYVQRSRVR